MNYYIVGVDPGNNIGLAFIDFEGKIIQTTTIVGSIEDSIKYIHQIGKPAIIATDVKPAPSFVLRLASYFNAKLFVPKNIIRESEKWRIIREQEKKEKKRICKNLHERDALFAAITAFRENQNLLRNILSLDIEEKEEVAYLVLQGYRTELAIQLIKNKKSSKEEEQEKEKEQEKHKKKMEDNKHQALLNEKLIKLEKENVELKKRINFLEQELLFATQEIKKLRNENYQRILKEKEITKLKAKINILKRVILFLRNKNEQEKLQKQENKKENLTQEKNEEKIKQQEMLQKRQKETKDKDLKELDTDIIIQIIENYRKKRQ
ncbi:MAG: DUF460 domain-containing protein [Candidatus Micrarchaeota archaeon]|nr:DUF460 domain-containing protein [Candidatus Micrarchaeota archaeon]